MNTINKEIKKLWKDESGQGMTEYILILVIVIAIAALFREQIVDAISSKVGDLSSQLANF